VPTPKCFAKKEVPHVSPLLRDMGSDAVGTNPIYAGVKDSGHSLAYTF